MPDWLFYAFLALNVVSWLTISLLHWRWRRRELARLRAELKAEEKRYAS